VFCCLTSGHRSGDTSAAAVVAVSRKSGVGFLNWGFAGLWGFVAQQSGSQPVIQLLCLGSPAAEGLTEWTFLQQAQIFFVASVVVEA